MTKVIVLGKGELGIEICEWFVSSPDHDLSLVVPVIPEPSWSDSISDWCKGNDIPIVESGHFKDIPGVQDDGWHIDLAMSVFYDRIIKSWFIERCGRILNIHNSPLPTYRGVSPINWALKNGEDHHGVTIHEITPGIDDGPIVSQVTYSIYPETDEVHDVYERSLRFASTLFRETMPLLDEIKPRDQDESKASYYSKNDDVRLGERRYFTREESLRRTSSS